MSIEAVSELSTMSGKEISIQGSPDIELWVESWNAKGNTALKATKLSDGYNIMLNSPSASNSSGSINVKTNNDYNTTANETNKTGYYDELYFPYRSCTRGDGSSGNAVGYWLASLGINANYNLCRVSYSGHIEVDANCSACGHCPRPMISIKK